MKTYTLTRNVAVPDPIRISLYRKAPELGPKILFFSGGSALNGLSQHLKNYTYNSIHLVTPFDSGGSSAKLRHAFNMPAIGDLRSRMMALADETITGHPEVYHLFTYRLSAHKSQKVLLQQLMNMIDGKDPLIKSVANPMRRLIRNLLGFFIEQMPKNFDLKGASIGNLALAGGYLNHHRHLDPVIYLFSKLVSVRGTVRAIVNDNIHLTAKLKSGDTIVGQHRLTGKEVKPINSKITQIMLSSHPDKNIHAVASIRKKNYKLIQSADLICFPPGSFYSSLMANLLPNSVISAIAANKNPKVFIPNLGNDPEQFGLSLKDVINKLVDLLKQASPQSSTDKLLNFILLDSQSGRYSGGIPKNLTKHGIQIIDTHLVSSQSDPYYDPELLSYALLSLT
ncbi:MAG: GAK system CofD-like protein [Thiotrichaceae bacterium]|nr:GAK system CofD-like protein [Thiotrichaceae bacterium]